jgi:hypothetical protein
MIPLNARMLPNRRRHRSKTLANRMIAMDVVIHATIVDSTGKISPLFAFFIAIVSSLKYMKFFCTSPTAPILLTG